MFFKFVFAFLALNLLGSGFAAAQEKTTVVNGTLEKVEDGKVTFLPKGAKESKTVKIGENAKTTETGGNLASFGMGELVGREILEWVGRFL